MGTSSDKAAILALLKKYRSGQATPEEIKRIHDWFHSFDNELQDDPAFTIAANEAALNILRAVKPARYLPLMRVAAVVIVGLTGLLSFLKYYKHTPAPVTWAEIIVEKGKRKKIALPDGTVVTMNALSVLKIPSNFGRETRELALSGEGVFDVKSDESKPFIIHTGKLKTTVLGTSFDIKAYPGEKNIQIAVLTGKVRVERDNKMLAEGITHNQVLTWNEQQNEHTLKMANAAEIADWQANRFYFQKATINEIAAVLERQYNISITLSGNMKRTCRYTLQLKNETIENAMHLLSQLSGITYRINNNEIKINTASCE
jgi:ferric-dicitrate binding protein FerR (iron transport regulator)